jgi:ketosteroid isomerase-like protein
VTVAEDIERIRRGYAAWNSGHVDAALEFIREDVEVRPVLGDVVAGDFFRGHDGFRHWYETVHASFEDFRAEIDDVREAGDGRYLVLLRFAGRGAASGADVSLQGAHVMTLEEGVVVAIDGYQDRAEALKAVDSKDEASGGGDWRRAGLGFEMASARRKQKRSARKHAGDGRSAS